MNNIDDFIKRLEELEGDCTSLLQQTNDSLDKILNSINNFSSDVEQISSTFEEMTHLEKEDYVFIVFCAVLQVCRQYFITDFKERLTDKEAAKEVKGKESKEKSDRNKKRYYCSTSKIISNPVPFDALEHDKKIHTGISGRNHRTKCLGHYPEFGYIFGTANIMTSTVTTKEGFANIQTYHVKTETLIRNYFYKKTGKIFSKSLNKDYIYSKANTSKMFEKCYSRIKDNPKEGIPALLAALAKEHEHLRSDERSIQSLPFPFLSFTPEISKSLQEYGFDYINIKTIGKQAAYSSLVNLITEVIYYAYHLGKQINSNKSLNKLVIDDLAKVRLRKIINVANVISTSTNFVSIVVGIFTNNLELVRKFDLGGGLVTFYNLSNSVDFMLRVKEEFIRNEIKIKNLENEII